MTLTCRMVSPVQDTVLHSRAVHGKAAARSHLHGTTTGVMGTQIKSFTWWHQESTYNRNLVKSRDRRDSVSGGPKRAMLLSFHGTPSESLLCSPGFIPALCTWPSTGHHTVNPTYPEPHIPFILSLFWFQSPQEKRRILFIFSSEKK